MEVSEPAKTRKNPFDVEVGRVFCRPEQGFVRVATGGSPRVNHTVFSSSDWHLHQMHPEHLTPRIASTIAGFAESHRVAPSLTSGATQRNQAQSSLAIGGGQLDRGRVRQLVMTLPVPDDASRISSGLIVVASGLASRAVF